MKHGIKRLLTVFLALAVLLTGCSSGSNDLRSKVTTLKLKNGLTVCLLKDTKSSKVFTGVAVKAGAFAQTKENAGYFHLYEHMMFNATSLYDSSTKIKLAFHKMNAKWDGITSQDSMYYYSSVDPSFTEQALSLWNSALRAPLLDEKEFENEKKVVISEQKDDRNSQYRMKMLAECDAFYENELSRKLVIGTDNAIQNATISDMLYIKDNYFNPENCMIFVGGNISRIKAYFLVRKIFGSWKSSENKKQLVVAEPVLRTDVCGTTYGFIESPQIGNDLIGVSWIFNTGISDKRKKSDDYTEVYLTALFNRNRRDFDFIGDEAFFMEADIQRLFKSNVFYSNWYASAFNLQDDVQEIREKIYDKTIIKIRNNRELFSPENHKKTIDYILKQLECKSEWDVFSILVDEFTTYGYDFSKDLRKKLNKVTAEDVNDYIERFYTDDAHPLVLVDLSHDNYIKYKDMFDNSFFKKIDIDSLWEKLNDDYSSEKSNEAFRNIYEAQSVYVPSENKHVAKVTKSPKVRKYTLKNGIPVYYKKNCRDKKNVISLCLNGGFLNETEENRGITSVLFEMMFKSSTHFTKNERNDFKDESGMYLLYSYSEDYSLFSEAFESEYEDKAVDMFADSIFYTDLSEQNFDEAKAASLDCYRDYSDYSKFYFASIAELYDGTGYDPEVYITSEDDDISLSSLMDFRAKFVTVGNISILISGNVNIKKILKTLNNTIGRGKVQFDEINKPVHENKDIFAQSRIKVIKDRKFNGTGHLLRFVPSPKRDDDDYYAFLLASKIYDFVFFDTIRSKYGDCYTPEVNDNENGGMGIGEESIYSLTDYSNVMAHMEEARNIMAEGSYIEECLEAKKIDLYEKLSGKNNSSWNYVEDMADNLTYRGEADYDKKLYKKIYGVTEDEVKEAFVKYYVDSPSFTRVVTGEDIDFDL